MPDTILEIKEVTKKFSHGVVAVNNVSFSISKGEIFGILGPKNSGKTTMLRLICGLTHLTEGDILIDGVSIKNDFKKAIRDVGALIHSPKLFNHMTCFDNLRYYANFYDGITDKDISNYARLLGFEHFLKKKISKCPKEIKQKIGIAQAIIHKPKLLIIDDPFFNLDIREVNTMSSLLKLLAEKEKIALIISSRMLGEMEKICNTIGVFSEGNMVELKTMVQLLEGSTNSQKLKFTVDYPNFAGKIIAEELKFKVSLAGNAILVYTNKSNLQKITNTLKKYELSIFKIEIITKTLEQVFAEILERRALGKSWLT